LSSPTNADGSSRGGGSSSGNISGIKAASTVSAKAAKEHAPLKS